MILSSNAKEFLCKNFKRTTLLEGEREVEPLVVWLIETNLIN